jgi:hypothetical protein
LPGDVSVLTASVPRPAVVARRVDRAVRVDRAAVLDCVRGFGASMVTAGSEVPEDDALVWAEASCDSKNSPHNKAPSIALLHNLIRAGTSNSSATVDVGSLIHASRSSEEFVQ